MKRTVATPGLEQLLSGLLSLTFSQRRLTHRPHRVPVCRLVLASGLQDSKETWCHGGASVQAFIPQISSVYPASMSGRGDRVAALRGTEFSLCLHIPLAVAGEEGGFRCLSWVSGDLGVGTCEWG